MKSKSTNQTYVVNDGGPDYDEYEIREEAMSRAWDRARIAAAWLGLDEDSLVEWGDDEHTGWGVCPANDNGTHWPNVTVCR